MHRSIILVALLWPAFALAERPVLSLGSGYEARMQREVNPDFVEMKSLGQLFGQVRFERWAIHTELSDEERVTNSGGLKIQAHSFNTGVWGRYLVSANQYTWRPFFGAGVGAYFDKITSRFGDALDERSGLRPYVGASVGLSAVYLKYLLLEAEARISGVRDRKEPMVSALFRAGVYF